MGLSTIDSSKPVFAVCGKGEDGRRLTQFVNATNEAEAFVAAKGFMPEFVSFEYAKQLSNEVLAEADEYLTKKDNCGLPAPSAACQQSHP